MNFEEIAIYVILVNHPDMVHISEDGKKLYFIADGQMYSMDGDFNGMTEEQVNEYFQKVLDAELN